MKTTVLLTAGLLAALGFVGRIESQPSSLDKPKQRTVGARTYGYGLTHYRRLGPEKYRYRWVRARRYAHRLDAKAIRLIRERTRLRQEIRALRKPDAAIATTGYGVWDRVAECEAGGDWGYHGDSGFEGGLQFHPGTWDGYKPAGFPDHAGDATRDQQIMVAERVLADQGWGAWPACSSRLGLR